MRESGDASRQDLKVVGHYITPRQRQVWKLRRAGLSQVQIARRLGVTRARVSELEAVLRRKGLVLPPHPPRRRSAAPAPMPERERARAARLLQNFTKRKVPPQLRREVRLELSWRGNAITLYERRPPWRGRLTDEWTKLPTAQFRYEGASGVWRLYWRRATGRWAEYRERPKRDIAAVIRAVEEDRFGAFWG